MLPALLLALAPPSVFLDLDFRAQQIPVSEGRWRCYASDVAEALEEAQANNHTSFGWSPFIPPITSNITGCEQLFLDNLEDTHPGLVPLGMAIQAACEHSFRCLESGCAAPGAPELRRLKLLDFEGSSLGDGGLAVLATAIGACTSIGAVHAPRNRIGDEGARALAIALQGPFDQERSQDPGPPHAGLRLLDLESNLIGDAGADGLAALLRLPAAQFTPMPLVELRLSHNRIGPVGLEILGESLRDNVQLEVLMLSDNPIGDHGCAALARGLVSRKAGRDSVLRRLYLATTNMTDAGAAQLRQALEQPHAPALEVLELEGNPGLSSGAREALLAVVARRRPTALISAPPSEDSLATGVFVSRL